MRKYAPLIGCLRHNPRHSRFPIPNAIWAYNLKPIEFVLLSYLCCQHSHGSTNVSPEMAAKGIHMTVVTVKKYLARLVGKKLITDEEWSLALAFQRTGDRKFFTLPNEIFLLSLPPSAFMVYAYLLLIEDRRTHTCHPSYNTIAAVTGLAKNTAMKNIHALMEMGLIAVEPSSYFDKRGLKWTGNNLYTILNEFYSGKPMECVPLSQQKEFRAIHNAVIQAALRLEQLTFEDRDMARYDEPDDILQGVETCGRIWSVVCDDNLPLGLRDEGVKRLHTQAEDGNHYAQLLLGKLYRDGPLLTPDWSEARYWFVQAAWELPDAQYALGKLLLTDDIEVHDREQGIRWLTRAAESGHEFAAYRLAKEFLKDGNTAEALPWLAMSAEADNPYAEYLLGELCWEGEDIPQDMGQAVYWLTQAAEQGHAYAQILLERQDSPSLPSAILAVNSLLHSIGQIFRDNAQTIDSTRDHHTDRKLRRKIQEKKIAMGHKPDDHEEQGWGGMTM